MGDRATPYRWSRLLSRSALAMALTLVLVLPAGSSFAAAAPTGAAAGYACPAAHTAYGISANVTWNGTNICTAGSASAALPIVFTQNAHVVFSWSSAGGRLLSVTDARLAMNYFGFAIATRDVGSITPPGSGGTPGGTFVMDWNPGALTYLLAGLYSVTATLFASNGSTVWSDTFYVKASAPYTLLAGIPIILILIAVAELYSVARSGRAAAAGRKAPTGEAPASPTSTSSSPAPTPSSPPAEAPETSPTETGEGAAGESAPKESE